MIGVIGPDDSVIRVRNTAAELGLGESVLTRTYATWQVVPELVAELDPVCGVLLFTGRVPYTIARETLSTRASLDFIPHEGADLYRALILVLRDYAGRLPVVSLDTIERSAVDETYLDLDLEPPVALLSFDDPEPTPGGWRSSDVSAFHEERYRNGEVELCLTCMGPVRNELRRLGVPVVRIEHTRAALREALRRASLTDRLARTEASQIAVALVQPRDEERQGVKLGPYEAQRVELRRRQQVVDLAERLQGTLSRASGASFLIHTTRGAVTAAFSSIDVRDDGAHEVRDGLLIGYGVGATVARAETNARSAATLGRHSGGTYVVLDDGTVLDLDDRPALPRYRLRETDPRLLARAKAVGLGPLTLARLATAFAELDPAAVTARDLATAYGVAPRSALRMLATLERSGIATAQGTRSAPRAGRPQIIYRVDLERLLPRAADPATVADEPVNQA